MTTPIGNRRDAEQTIAALARDQHGVVTRAQLIAAGVAEDQVDRRLRDERLRPLHRGVYVVGPIAAPLAEEMGAVLACGATAVVSHRSAAALWHLLPVDGQGPPAEGRHARAVGSAARNGGRRARDDSRRTRRREAVAPPTGTSDGDAVDVIIPRGGRRYRPGVVVHRMELRPDEVTKLDRIPVTTPERTLYDLAATIGGRALERALAEALDRRLTTQARIEALLARHQRRAGTGRLRGFLSSGEKPALTRSEAEECFLALVRRGQLPGPEVNVRVHGHEVDFLWRTARLVAEIDGFAFHSSRRRFESDRRRDGVLTAAGLRVMRVTWEQIEREPAALLVRLTQALMHNG